MIKIAQEAEAAVLQAKYPSRGVRGFGYSRASIHGIDFDQTIARANDQIAMIMQIEHKDTVRGPVRTSLSGHEDSRRRG